MADTQSFLSPDELAELLNIPIGTVYQWNTRGVGPRRLTVGRHVRYRVRDVEAWLRSCEAPGKEAS